MLEGRCVIGTLIISISLNGVKNSGPETDLMKIENLITMRLSEEGLRRPYSSPATQPLFHGRYRGRSATDHWWHPTATASSHLHI